MAKTPAERMREYRRRKKQGARLLKVVIEVPAETGDELCERKFLKDWDCEIAEKISDALSKALNKKSMSQA